MAMETQTELTAYEKRMLELAERQTDSLDLLRYIGIALIVLALIGGVIGAIVGLS